jgi:plasmid stabilization system protein ParE
MSSDIAVGSRCPARAPCGRSPPAEKRDTSADARSFREQWNTELERLAAIPELGPNSVDHGREKFEYQFHSQVRPASTENARL